MYNEERVIPGFENYTINRAGEVFNRDTDRRLRVTHQGGRPNGFYQLYKRGKKYNKSERVLYELAFGVGEETYIEDGIEWRTIEDFPNYEMNAHAEVRRRDTKAPVYAYPNVSGTFYFRLSHQGIQQKFREDTLFSKVFPRNYEESRRHG